MTTVVVSPHLDDGVLSLGGALAEYLPVCVVTVFAGVPPAWSWPTPFDNASGFSDSQAAVHARRVEDRAACRLLGATVRHLPFLDGQYGIAPDEEQLTATLGGLICQADRIVVPLGLAHPDHRLVAKLCRRVLDGRACVIYADLPSAKLYPGHVPGALRGWTRAGYTLDTYDAPRDLDVKRKAVECYASQLRFAELAWENLTEERAWSATPTENSTGGVAR